MPIRNIIIFSFLLLFPLNYILADKKPKIANYFLNDQIYEHEIEALAKWDVLILDMEMQRNNPQALLEIRKTNPNIILLAYISSQEIYSDLSKRPTSSLRRELLAEIEDSWWLRDLNGDKVSFWPGTHMFNMSDQVEENYLGEKFNDFLPRFVQEKIQSSNMWDGVFYDNIWNHINWINKSLAICDNEWKDAYLKMLKKTRELCGENFLILGNGQVYEPYLTDTHGIMLEGFPSQWEGTWSDSMNRYLKTPFLSRQPSMPIINVYNNNKNNYQVFRFGLTSALLGDGYYSFDYDVTFHGQTWWYDEYDINLGQATSAHYNLLDNNGSDLKPGLWRRDFENASIIVNSTTEKQRIIFDKEIFEKIKGSQDTLINNGKRINWLELESMDGVLLLKEIDVIKDTSFINGQFINVLDNQGREARASFFSYLNQFPPLSEVFITDLFSNGQEIFIYSHQGEIIIVKNGNEINRFTAFHPAFKGPISLALGDINGNGQKEIVAGAGYRGGPQVNVFNNQGKLVSSFFAYDKNFRGGVSVAVGDTNGNNKAEIITSPGPGGGPHVRIFDYLGKELSNFFVYDKNLRTGLTISSADVTNNGKAEILVAPLNGENLELKYFNDKGVKLNSFTLEGQLNSLKLSTTDLTSDNQAEILFGINHY
jgi:hypothetical protein